MLLRNHRHATLGRGDDRDDPSLRTHDPRAGFAPLDGGLDHDATFYVGAAADPAPAEPPAIAHAVADGRSAATAASVDVDRSVDPHRRRRSDVRIYDAVWDALASDEDLDLPRFGAFHVHVNDGVVQLIGLVDALEQKWRARELCFGVGGVVDVDNRLRVRHPVPRALRRRWRATGAAPQRNESRR